MGPKGNSLKRLQEETLTKMAVLGKGSMRDKAREEELRLSKDPKYLHLSEDLHVEVAAFAPLLRPMPDSPTPSQRCASTSSPTATTRSDSCR